MVDRLAVVNTTNFVPNKVAYQNDELIQVAQYYAFGSNSTFLHKLNTLFVRFLFNAIRENSAPAINPIHFKSHFTKHSYIFFISMIKIHSPYDLDNTHHLESQTKAPCRDIGIPSNFQHFTVKEAYSLFFSHDPAVVTPNLIKPLPPSSYAPSTCVADVAPLRKIF